MAEDKAQDRITCIKCKKSMAPGQFYSHSDGDKINMCKNCLTMHIDNFDESTYVWILEKMDVPYIRQEWNSIRDKAFMTAPTKMTGKSVLGKYLSKMKLMQWNDKRWADTEELQREADERQREREEEEERKAKRKEERLKEQLKKGKITAAEFEAALNPADIYKEMMEESLKGDPTQFQGDPVGSNNLYPDDVFLEFEQEMIDVGKDLTEEDKKYLAMKWGRTYRPYEWVELEKTYTDMKGSFDVTDADTENTLILVCKINLKMNQALDEMDLDTYNKLYRGYDTLRKSAKFTAAQNKDQSTDFIDSVGELVTYCEKHGGKIPKFDLTFNRDIIDTVIKDLKDYNKSLIYEDKALASQIEDYIRKREIAEKIEKDRKDAKAQGKDYVNVGDEDHIEEMMRISQEIMSDKITLEEEGYTTEEEGENNGVE